MNALSIQSVEGPDLAEWDAYVRAHPASTVYHLAAWRRIFGDGFGYRGWLLAARATDGTIRGVLPLYLVHGLAGRRLVAVPFRDRGGPLFDDAAALEALLVHAQALAREQRAALILKSLVPLPEVESLKLLVRVDHWTNSRMALSGLDRKALWERVGGKNRNMVRQAEQGGLQAVLATADGDGAARWHRLHRETQHRLGIPAFPLAFFSTMLDALRPAGGIELLEVRKDGLPVAATLLLVHGDTCIYGYSASSAQGQRARANDLMLCEALAHAAQRGLAWFDFGSDSPAQESLLFFKRKWGAEQRQIPLYASGDAAVSDSSDARYALARGVFRALPEAITSWIGARVVKHFG